MKDADRFPFVEGDMVKFNGQLYYIHDVHDFHHKSTVTVFLMKVGTYTTTRVEFAISDLKRKSFVDAMKPTEDERNMALLLHDEYDENYFLSASDHTLDVLRYSLASTQLSKRKRWPS